MTRELPSEPTIDHSDRLRSIPDTRYNRDRTIHLWFLPKSGHYVVRAWGGAFAETGGGGYRGCVHTDPAMIQAGIGDLRATWETTLIHYVEPGSRPTRRPFVDDWDLSRAELDGVGRTLARAGYSLFKLLFMNGDSTLDVITKLLVSAMRAGEQIVTVESEDLFVPWGMLYVPLSDEESIWSDDYEWSPDGFWAYRNVLEHNFAWSPGFDSRIALSGPRVTVGLNVDQRVDSDPPYPSTPCIQPMIDFFSARATTTVRTRKAELAAALQNPDFADDIVFFGCHGSAGTADTGASLVLGDGERIYSSEVLSWLAKRTLPTRPLVFVGACQGGQLVSVFNPVFGHHLLHHGARSLIGPQIEVPRAFAREYGMHLFSAFLKPHTKLGDIVRDLTRRFLDEHHNPLGLIFSLYRGIDVHLSPPPGP